MHYIIYKKNINMVPSKMAYETLRMSQAAGLTERDKILIIGVSTKKFNALVAKHKPILREDNTNIVDGKPLVTTMCIEVEGTLNIRL